MKAGTVGDVIVQRAKLHPERAASVFHDRRTSYRALDEYSNQVANRFYDCGLSRGDRVGYLGKNTDAFFEIFFGAAKSGVVLSTLNWRLAAPEIDFIVRDSGLKLLFAGAEFAPVLRDCASIDECGVRVVFLEAGDDGEGFAHWRARGGRNPPAVSIDPDDVCVLMYTSGTTGHPKGVLITHRNFLAQRHAEETLGGWALWADGEVNLVSMPVFHIGGSGWGFLAYYYGATNIIHETPDTPRILDDIAAHGITRMFIVPTVLQQLVQLARKAAMELSSMRCVVYGASPISPDLLKTALAYFDCEFVQQYGMTEATGAATFLPPGDHDIAGNARMLSCGIPFPGIEIRIVDEDRRALAAGAIGEIAIKSPAMMAGYWNRETQTAEVLQDGWYYSGDVGFLDGDGYLFLVDRKSDMIISGGE
ncbi:MAG: AMP-binding protein, partial [Parvularculaceae bacterium]|nr:AMP-binding protein [Parvularculaceae bacterium]